MEETLRRVGLLFDSHKNGQNSDLPIQKEVGRPPMQELGGKLPFVNDRSRGTKTHETRDEEILQFLLWLEELQKFDPETFNTILSHSGLGHDEKKESKHEYAKEELSSVIKHLKAKRSNYVVDSRETINNHINIPDKVEKPRTVGIKVVPSPGFTLKTVSVNDGSKVFINICSHEEICEPSMKKKLNDVGEEVEVLNIPMSVGPPHPCKDKSGIICTAYDVIVSPKVLGSSKDDSTGQYKDFVCKLGIQSVQQKLDESLDQRYKLPKGLIYMGDEIQSQMIQDRKKVPYIEEIRTNIIHNNRTEKRLKSAVDIERELPVKLFWEKENVPAPPPTNGTDTNFSNYVEPLLIPPADVVNITVVAAVDMNTEQTIVLDDFEVKISMFKAMVKLPSFKSKVIFFPCAIKVNAVLCELKHVEESAGKYEFMIHAEMERGDWDIDADPGSKNWLMRTAIRYDLCDPSSAYAITASSSQEYKEAPHVNGNKINEEAVDDEFQSCTSVNIKKCDGLAGVEGDSMLEVSSKTPCLQGHDDNEFAEDKFHKRDANSQFIINRREQDIKNKWLTHEKEKQKRVDDPSVEYLDVDDFKPGGKYGSHITQESLQVESKYMNSARDTTEYKLSQASKIVREGIVGFKKETLGEFKCNLWSELLD